MPSSSCFVRQVAGNCGEGIIPQRRRASWSLIGSPSRASFEYRSATTGEHYRLIVEAMHEKVRQNPEVRQVLLQRETWCLRPDHRQSPNDPPEWRYFDIMMQIRSELQSRARDAEIRIDKNRSPV